MLEEAAYQRSLSAQFPFLRNPVWGELLVNASPMWPLTPRGPVKLGHVSHMLSSFRTAGAAVHLVPQE